MVVVGTGAAAAPGGGQGAPQPPLPPPPPPPLCGRGWPAHPLAPATVAARSRSGGEQTARRRLPRWRRPAAAAAVASSRHTGLVGGASARPWRQRADASSQPVGTVDARWRERKNSPARAQVRDRVTRGQAGRDEAARCADELCPCAPRVSSFGLSAIENTLPRDKAERA